MYLLSGTEMGGQGKRGLRDHLYTTDVVLPGNLDRLFHLILCCLKCVYENTAPFPLISDRVSVKSDS